MLPVRVLKKRMNYGKTTRAFPLSLQKKAIIYTALRRWSHSLADSRTSLIDQLHWPASLTRFSNPSSLIGFWTQLWVISAILDCSDAFLVFWARPLKRARFQFFNFKVSWQVCVNVFIMNHKVHMIHGFMCFSSVIHRNELWLEAIV